MFVVCPVAVDSESSGTRVSTLPATEVPVKFTTRPTAATWYPEKTTTGEPESKPNSRLTSFLSML